MQFIGNQKVTELLKRSLERGMLNHAYLFSGPEHLGKFMLAKMFSLSAIGGKKLSLETDNFDKDALLDLVVVSPEVIEKKGVSKKRDISIESIRNAKQNLGLFPYHGKYRVLIIDDAHKMNVSAQNALLKILEEPNQTTMIILVTNEIGKILLTIQSRLQIVNFSLVSDEEMQKYFSKEIVAISAGRPGLAEVVSKNEIERSFRMEAQKQLESLGKNSIGEKFALAEELSKDIVKTLEKLDAWTWEMRKKALSEVNSRHLLQKPHLSRVRDIPSLSGEENNEKTFKGEENTEEIFGKMEKIQKSIENLKNTNANAKLVLEALFLDL